MALVVDAGPLYAQANASDPRHEAVRRVLLAERGPLVTTEFVAAEADYLILDRLGVDVEIAFARDLEAGTFLVDCLRADELRTARVLTERYRDLRLGLADASLIVLADRYRTNRILTFDERAFRAVVPIRGGTFTILPADEG